MFCQDGGMCRVGGYSISLGQGGTGVVYQAGGTLVCTDQDIQLGETRYTGFQDTFASFANWTIAGTAQTETRNFWGGRHSNLASSLNLIDGGTLYANNVHKGETANLPTGSYVTELFNNDFFVNNKKSGYVFCVRGGDFMVYFGAWKRMIGQRIRKRRVI